MDEQLTSSADFKANSAITRVAIIVLPDSHARVKVRRVSRRTLLKVNRLPDFFISAVKEAHLGSEAEDDEARPLPTSTRVANLEKLYAGLPAHDLLRERVSVLNEDRQPF